DTRVGAPHHSMHAKRTGWGRRGAGEGSWVRNTSGGPDTPVRTVLYDQGAWSWSRVDDLFDNPSGARRQTEPDERCRRRRNRAADRSGGGNEGRGTMTKEGATIFIVDDDPGVLKALTRLVGANGYQTRSFTSPREFLAHHDAELPGCAVFDVSM